MNKYWVELNNIDIYYEGNKVINDLNLRLKLGENTVIIGENGSGKSTLLKTITKLKYPRAKAGCNINHLGSSKLNIWEMRKAISFVLSEIDLRIKKNMLSSDVILSGYQGTFGIIDSKLISKKHRDNLEIIKELLNINNIAKYYCELSDGQKRRVLIARAIINNPKVLILDEPTSMLDLKAKYELLAILSDLTNRGITLLYVTNNIDNIIKEVDRVIFIKKGKLILDGNPSDVINSINISNLYNYQLSATNIGGYWRTLPKTD